jgi:IS1 family transposase
MYDLESGDQYTYLSIDRNTKLVFNFLVGKRSMLNAAAFMRDLKSRVEGRFQLTTDGFTGYTGRTGSVANVFGEQVDYGTEVKHFGKESEGPRRYSPSRCVSSTRTVQSGNPDPKFINTSHVERVNLSFRLFNRRLTRLTMGFSKKLDNLKHAMALFIAHYNFCRVHGSIKKTPAMAHGITNHIWKIEDLLTQ